MLSSIVLKNIKSFKRAFSDNINIIDIKYNGLGDDSTLEIINGKCIINAVKIWLQSGTNDYSRNPGYGGFFEREVVKRPMNDESCEIIKSALTRELNEKFASLDIVDIDIGYNLSKRWWEVKVAVRDKKTGLMDTSMIDDGVAIVWKEND